MIKRLELFFTFLLLPFDIAMIILAFVLAYYSRSQIEIANGFANIGMIEYLKYALYLLPAWIGLIALNGLYAFKNRNGFLSDFYRIFISASVAVLLLIVLIFLTKTSFFSRIILILTWVFSIALITLGRMFLKSFRKILLAKGIGQTRLLIIGSSSTAENLIKELKQKSIIYYNLVGYLSDDEEIIKGKKLLGNSSQIEDVIKEYNIEEVILTDQNISKDQMSFIIKTCDNYKIAFKFIPDIYSLVTSNFRPGLIGAIPTMELKPISLDGWGRIIKRIIDFTFALIFLMILSPFLLIIALIVKLTSKGPVFYRHTRISRDEKPFYFYKYRSMFLDKCDWAEKGVWTTAQDDNTRVTPLGKILRKTNLDELPQLWNILKGDMSFVGPRPELPKLVEKFESQIPEYFRRHRVKSGLTGWAQVNGLKGDTSVEERVRYDIYYIENWSLLLDFKIVLKTIWLIIYEIFKGKYEYSSRS